MGHHAAADRDEPGLGAAPDDRDRAFRANDDPQGVREISVGMGARYERQGLEASLDVGTAE